MKRFEVEEVCTSCDGTGLFSGMAERSGVAVVCNRCNGTGKVKFVHEYKPFKKKARIPSYVKWVLETNPGFVVGDSEESDLSVFRGDFGGMSIDEYKAGKSFRGLEMRRLICPKWHNQRFERAGGECSKSLGMRFSNCHQFENKETCWEEYDKWINEQEGA